MQMAAHSYQALPAAAGQSRSALQLAQCALLWLCCRWHLFQQRDMLLHLAIVV